MNADNKGDGIQDPGDEALAGFFQMATQRVEVWDDQDYPSLWKHQMDSPLDKDMAELLPESRETLQETMASGQVPPNTYRELFAAKSPGLSLLQNVKDYAKKLQAKPDLLPKELSLALYYASLATALVKCGNTISSLGPDDMRKAFTWAKDQDWIDPDIQAIFSDALASLG